ncbi:MAG: hypothetical protein NTY17_02315 [Planctomycetia bacterium]|nr:hypothetical protein [Planctomycetia bacterium]
MLAESIRDELVKVFTVPQSEVLAQCVVRAHDALATRSDVHDLRVAMTALAEQQKLTSAEVHDLAEQQKLTSAELRDLSHTVADLADTVRTLHIRTDKTAGWALEWVVGNRLPAYVGRQIKRCRVVGPMDVIESLENRPAIRGLSDEDLDQLRRADLIATGVIDDEKIYLVGEVSFTADNDDVLRAARRAAVLRKVGERAQPFVACDAIAPISAELAQREGVWIIVEGRILTPAA